MVWRATFNLDTAEFLVKTRGYEQRKNNALQLEAGGYARLSWTRDVISKTPPLSICQSVARLLPILHTFCTTFLIPLSMWPISRISQKENINYRILHFLSGLQENCKEFQTNATTGLLFASNICWLYRKHLRGKNEMADILIWFVLISIFLFAQEYNRKPIEQSSWVIS